jgi:hypothetical protein
MMMEDDVQVIEPDEGVNGESPPPEEGETESQGSDIPKPKDGIQERINELTRKRREAERDAAYWRGVAQGKPAQPQAPTPAPKKDLDPMDFDSNADYLKAVAAQIRDEARAEIEAERKAENDRRTKAAVAQTLNSARTKYSDFDEVALNPSVPISQEMWEASMGDNLGDILYYLGKNPAEAARIATLNPIAQAKEIGKIETKATTKIKKPTGAPSPPDGLPLGTTLKSKKDSEKSRSELHAEWEKTRLASLGVTNV